MKILIIFFAAGLVACTGKHKSWDEFYVHRSIKNNTYLDPVLNFSVGLPLDVIILKLKEYSATQSRIDLYLSYKPLYQGDVHEGLRIEVEQNPFGENKILSGNELKKAFHEGALTHLRNSRPGIQIVHQEIFQDAFGLCYFSMTHMPTSQLVKKSDNYLNAILVFAIFQKGDLCITLSIEETYNPLKMSSKEIAGIYVRQFKRIMDTRNSFKTPIPQE